MPKIFAHEHLMIRRVATDESLFRLVRLVHLCPCGLCLPFVYCLCFSRVRVRCSELCYSALSKNELSIYSMSTIFGLSNSVRFQHLKSVERVLEAHYLVIHVSLMRLQFVLEAVVPLTQLAQLCEGSLEPLTQLSHQALQLYHKKQWEYIMFSVFSI